MLDKLLEALGQRPPAAPLDGVPADAGARPAAGRAAAAVGGLPDRAAVAALAELGAWSRSRPSTIAW